MDKKILALPFAKLLKLEVRKVALEVIRIVENHEPELLQIKPMYDVLIAEKPKIDGLSVPHKAHPANISLRRLRKERNVHVKAIKFELNKVIALDPTGDDKTVVLLEIEINRFLEDYHSSKNDLIRNEKLDLFLREIDRNLPLEEALENKGFIPLLNNLKMNLSDVVAQLNLRTQSISKRPTVKTEVLRRHVVKAVVNMFNEIYLAQFKNPEVDYAPLFNELNVMLKGIDYLVNIRLANNERKAAERKAAEMGTPTTKATSTQVQTTVAGTDNGYHPSQVYMASIKKIDNPAVGPTSSIEKIDNPTASPTGSIESGNGSLESKDQKKAAANDWSSAQQLEEEKGTSRS